MLGDKKCSDTGDPGGEPLMSMKERLEQVARLLEAIDSARTEHGDPELFLQAESVLIGRELAEIEQEWRPSPPPADLLVVHFPSGRSLTEAEVEALADYIASWIQNEND
jgi:hypothetical protein